MMGEFGLSTRTTPVAVSCRVAEREGCDFQREPRVRASGGHCVASGAHAIDAFVVVQQRREGLEHVPLDVVCQLVQEQMAVHPRFAER